MDKERFGENGDFTILEDVVSKLTSNNFSGSDSGTSFPIMDLRDQDESEEDGVVDLNTTNSGGFNDERHINRDDTESRQEVSGGERGFESDDDGASLDEAAELDEADNNETESSEQNEESFSDTDSSEEDKKSKKGTGNDIPELGEAEPEITAYVQEKLFDKLGWELDEKDSLKDVDSLVDYMEKIVEANSKPNFANKDMEELNTFVSNGGDLKDFFGTQGDVNIDTLDLQSDYGQKAVIKEALSERGLSDKEITKKIQRYEEAGILEDEALDSTDYVKNIRAKKAETLLQAQAKLKSDQEEQQQKFYDDVNSTIDSMNEVRGIPLNRATKNKLKAAILKVESDGQTSYQKKYKENFVKNMLESAYFTIEGDSMVKNLNKKAESKATINLKRKLETRTKKGKGSGSLENESTNSRHNVLDVFSSFIKP